MTVSPSTTIAPAAGRQPGAANAWAALAAVIAAACWSYWPTLMMLARDWGRDPNYSAGQLVPIAAVFLAFSARRELFGGVLRPSLWGVGLLLAAQGVRYVGVMQLLESVERYSFVVALAGLVLLIGGWTILRKAAPLLAFLLLMIPFPGRVHNMISGPLQDLAASGAIGLLELLGYRLLRDGFTLTLNDTATVAIVEGCSGLRLLTAFIIVAAVLALLVERPAWQKIFLVVSSVPIAILCNILRLTATAMLCAHVSSRTAETFFHDFAGVSMMPVAVLMLLGELWVMKKLVIPDQPGPGNHAVTPTG